MEAIFLHLSGTHILSIIHNDDDDDDDDDGIFADTRHNAGIFAVALVMLYHSFSSMTLSLMVMITLYSPWNRFFLKRKALSEDRIVSINENEYRKNSV